MAKYGTTDRCTGGTVFKSSENPGGEATKAFDDNESTYWYGTGSRTVTWFNTIKWTDGTTPTLSTGANKIDSFGFICKSAGNYQGYIIGQNL